MSEETGEHPSITERITEKIHEYRGSSSSSDSDNEKPSHNTRKKRLFGRRDPVHTVFGGGKCNFYHKKSCLFQNYHFRRLFRMALF